jgi:two-component system, LytTR family, sensor kinase
MQTRATQLRPGIKWGVIFLCWTGFALFFAYQMYLGQYRATGHLNWLNPLLICCCWAYAWFGVTPVILAMIRRWPFERQRPIRGVLTHTLAATLVFCLNSALYIPLVRLVVGASSAPRPLLAAIWHVIWTEIHIGLVVYWLILGIVQGLDYYLRYRASELHAANLETQLVQSQLQALRAQLHPHFLFNTLNSISVLMRKDVEAANRMLLQLSSLLRLTLSRQATHEIKLRQELEMLERYLEIEKIRFQDRLTVRMQIDPTTLDALVPQLLLQPLVENALRHGIAKSERGGFIEIRAARQNGLVQLQVRDNGPGLKPATEALSEGVGLANSRARLEYLYGANSQFDVRNAEDGGVIATASLPFHTETTLDLIAKE